MKKKTDQSKILYLGSHNSLVHHDMFQKKTISLHLLCNNCFCVRLSSSHILSAVCTSTVYVNETTTNDRFFSFSIKVHVLNESTVFQQKIYCIMKVASRLSFINPFGGFLNKTSLVGIYRQFRLISVLFP